MRFDDSLKTVLSADMDSGFGAQSGWRQLVDLMGRGRIVADERAIARLDRLRPGVPVEVRAASARALAFAAPPAALVAFFAEDVFAVAAPILRTAILGPEEWVRLLPRMTPQGRALLRHRRDLSRAIVAALEGFATVDFVLPHSPVPVPLPDSATAAIDEVDAGEEDTGGAVSESFAHEPSPFILRDVVFSPPSDPEWGAAIQRPVDGVRPAALRHPADERPAGPDQEDATDRADVPFPRFAGGPQPVSDGGYLIADLVARIDAFQRERGPDHPPTPGDAMARSVASSFRFDTDAAGVIRAVDGVARGPLIGASLAGSGPQGVVKIDAVMTGALRQRQRFAGARLDIDGGSDAAGSWRVAGMPLFDEATGRFTGYAAIARRPRSDEHPGVPSGTPLASGKAASDSLRQLVHELRTPVNAIAGFAELIEAQLLGPVSPVYRDHALTIREQATDLLGAIDDLDTAARIEGGALDLRPGPVTIEPMLIRIAQDLEPLATLRGTALDVHPMGDHAALADDRAMERLLSRLLAALTSAAVSGERIDIAEAPAPEGQVAICFARPQALGTGGDEHLLSIDSDADDAGNGAPLLGVGFALRLARNLALELGGELIFGDHLLTLRLPAAADGNANRAAI